MGNYRNRLKREMEYCHYQQPQLSSKCHILHVDQGNTGMAAPFLKEKETSRLGWNDVLVWN